MLEQGSETTAFPYYASAEQIMRDRSDPQPGRIARGRSVVTATYVRRVLFVAESRRTRSQDLRIYDRISSPRSASHIRVQSLRRAGIQLRRLRGYSYDRLTSAAANPNA